MTQRQREGRKTGGYQGRTTDNTITEFEKMGVKVLAFRGINTDKLLKQLKQSKCYIFEKLNLRKNVELVLRCTVISIYGSKA